MTKRSPHLPIIVAWIVGFIVSGGAWVGGRVGVVLEIVVRSYAVPDIGQVIVTLYAYLLSCFCNSSTESVSFIVMIVAPFGARKISAFSIFGCSSNVFLTLLMQPPQLIPLI